MVSYSRFVQLQKEVLTVLTFYLSTHLSALVAGSLSWIPHVCASAITGGFHRIASLCQKRDARKHLMGWFYAFKLHLVINEQGEILGTLSWIIPDV